ncbi:MAG: cytochrome c [Rhodoferax sp.]|nr:cytochrome c [Rhodoferax sp.]
MTLRAGEWIVVAGALLIGAFAALVGTLIYLKPPPVMYGYAESAAANHGETIYKKENCRDCHQVFGNGSTSGPRLDGIGALRSVSWFKAYLIDPRPGVGEKTYRVTMPSYARLNEEDRDALVAYLLALKPLGAQDSAIP